MIEVNFEAVLDRYDSLLPPGRERGMIHCPLHEDNHPSMSVNMVKGVWKCHSCGEGGDGWTLIKLKEGLDFDGAREFAAGAGLTADGTGSGGVGVSDEPAVLGFSGRTVAGSARSDKRNSKYVPRWKRAD